MSQEPDTTAEPEPGEHALAERLAAQRPVPAAGFRGALARRLATRDPGYGTRPARLRLLVAGCLAAGGLLIGAGTLISAGVL